MHRGESLIIQSSHLEELFYPVPDDGPSLAAIGRPRSRPAVVFWVAAKVLPHLSLEAAETALSQPLHLDDLPAEVEVGARDLGGRVRGTVQVGAVDGGEGDFLEGFGGCGGLSPADVGEGQVEDAVHNSADIALSFTAEKTKVSH